MLLGILAHHSEAADPDLLHAIKEQLDSIFSLGPATLVLIFGAVIVAIPIAIVVFSMYQRRRASS